MTDSPEVKMLTALGGCVGFIRELTRLDPGELLRPETIARAQAYADAGDAAAQEFIQAPPKKADYFYDVDNWDVTHHSLEEVVEHTEGGAITEVGRLVEIDSVFVAEIYNEADDEYEKKEFATREEAQAAIDAAKVPE